MIIFAHLGGIDEVGIYIVPIILAIVSLRWAEKRVRKTAEERESDQMSSGHGNQADDR